MFKLFLIALPLIAQPDWRFEVASIRPTPNGTSESSVSQDSALVRYHNISLSNLIQIAYGIREDQLSGLPNWAKDQHYDITAKPDQPEVNDRKTENRRAAARVRNLLQERFHLKTHEESKELSLYLLREAKGGHKMKATPDDIPYGGNMQGTDLDMRGAPIDLLTATIEFTAGHRVFNDTGLTGRYDIKLHWRDERIGGEGPSIFVALREQLGLQLDSKKGPVTILIIEHIDRPTEN